MDSQERVCGQLHRAVLAEILALLQDALRAPELTAAGQQAVVAAADALLGLELGTLDPDEFGQHRAITDLDPAVRQRIERLISERTQARQQQDWARADRIRGELDQLDVQVTDTNRRPTWQLR